MMRTSTRPFPSAKKHSIFAHKDVHIGQCRLTILQFLSRYKQLEVTEDLDLVVRLYNRYSQLRVTDDLDEAISLSREALRLRSQGHPDRSMSLNNLAVHLSSRYKQLWVTEDLDLAVVLEREALDLRPIGHRNRVSSSNNLTVDLSTRYSRLGATEDLDEARHPYRSISSDYLAVDLHPVPVAGCDEGCQQSHDAHARGQESPRTSTLHPLNPYIARSVSLFYARLLAVFDTLYARRQPSACFSYFLDPLPTPTGWSSTCKRKRSLKSLVVVDKERMHRRRYRTAH